MYVNHKNLNVIKILSQQLQFCHAEHNKEKKEKETTMQPWTKDSTSSRHLSFVVILISSSWGFLFSSWCFKITSLHLYRIVLFCLINKLCSKILESKLANACVALNGHCPRCSSQNTFGDEFTTCFQCY